MVGSTLLGLYAPDPGRRPPLEAVPPLLPRLSGRGTHTHLEKNGTYLVPHGNGGPLPLFDPE